MVEEIQQVHQSREQCSVGYDSCEFHLRVFRHYMISGILPLRGSFSVIIQISVSSGYSGNSLTRYRVSPCMLCQHLETLLNEANLASTALLSEAQMFSIAFPSLTRLGILDTMLTVLLDNSTMDFWQSEQSSQPFRYFEENTGCWVCAWIHECRWQLKLKLFASHWLSSVKLLEHHQRASVEESYCFLM